MPPKRVLAVALTFFAIAAVAGLALVVIPRSSGGCSRSAPWRSSPPGSTRAASGRTATTDSASCSCSCSSGSSRRRVGVYAGPHREPRGVDGRRGRRPHRVRRAHGEQPARHRPGPRRRQAHALGSWSARSGRASCSPCSCWRRSPWSCSGRLLLPARMARAVRTARRDPACIIVGWSWTPRELIIAL